MLLFFHFVLCVVLIFIILLQAGKSGGSLSPLGGSSQSLFGATGAGNFLTRGTTMIAVLFFITSLTLTIATSKEASESIVKEAATPVEGIIEPAAETPSEEGEAPVNNTFSTPPTEEKTE